MARVSSSDRRAEITGESTTRRRDRQVRQCYEARWTVRQVLAILVGQFEPITAEPLGEIAASVKFTLQRAAETQVHQVNRQHGEKPVWDSLSLKAKDVLEHAQRHVEAVRQFYFVSTTPCPVLDDLAGRVRQTPGQQSLICRPSECARRAGP